MKEGRRKRPLFPRLEATPGFWVLLGLLFYLDEGLGLLGWGLLACALHELGHVLAVGLLGGRFGALRLSAVGAQLTLDPGRPLSYGRELLCALAGPAVSLLTAWVAAGGRLFLLAGLSLGQGLFNLLPLLPLDGGRCLYLFLAPLAGEQRAERALELASSALVGLLLGGGLILVRVFGNFTLLVTALWLTAGLLRRPGRAGGGVFSGKRRKKCLQFPRGCGNILQSEKGRSSARPRP